MSRSKSLVLLAGAAVGLGGASALAQTANLDAARARNAELTADAAERQSLLAADTSAGEGGFTISDASGDYTLNIQGQLQVRYQINVRGTPPAAGDEDVTLGFENRRSKIWFSGNIGSPDWGYHIETMYMYGGSGGIGLGDAYITHNIDDNWSVQAGQFKLPFMRESTVDSRYQLAHERSTTDFVFNLGRSEGIQLNFTQEDFRFMVAYSNGGKTPDGVPAASTANTPFASASHSDFAFTGRGEYKIQGDWDVFDDFTSFQGSENAYMVGGAIHYQNGNSTSTGTAPTADVSLLSFTVDGSVEGNGWNAYAALIWASEENNTGAGLDTDEFGFVLQGGYFVTADDELFGRYDITMADDAREPAGTTTADPFQALTFGWNHYFIPESHAAKLTAGVQLFLSESAGESSALLPGGANVGGGLLADTDSGQFDLFGQMQLLF